MNSPGIKAKSSVIRDAKRVLAACAPRLVYLATPYSHSDPKVKERRFHVVNRVAARLMSHGVHVFSPISHTHPIAVDGHLPGGWDFWEAYDRAVLNACSKLIVLMQDGWKESTGVQAEIAIAEEFGLPVEFIEPTREDMFGFCIGCGTPLMWPGDVQAGCCIDCEISRGTG